MQRSLSSTGRRAQERQRCHAQLAARSASAAERLLHDLQHRYVAITCELDELERRERARGDRPPGLARRQQASVLPDVPYPLHVDTTTASVNDCAAAIAKLFSSAARTEAGAALPRPRPRA